MLLSVKANDGLRLTGFHQIRLDDGSECWLWARGYFFDACGVMHLDDEIVDWLALNLGKAPLEKWVPGMNGCFSIVIVREKPLTIEVGIDRYGMYPVFYHAFGETLAISDDFWQVAAGVKSKEYDLDAVMSMVLLGYVAGYRTLLRGVTEFEQASTHRFDFNDGRGQIHSQRYWQMGYENARRDARRLWQEELSNVLVSVFERHAQAALERDWQVCVPLSGGKDSRLIAAMYRQNGASVRAFSYGPTGNPETTIARLVAAALDIPLAVTPIDDPAVIERDLIRSLTRRVGMVARFTAGLGAQLSLRGYSDHDVYVPGHVDLVFGVKSHRGIIAVRSEEQAIRHLMDSHFLLLDDDLAHAVLGSQWNRERARSVIADSLSYSPLDPEGSIVRWNYENRQRRAILAEMRTYATFGHWMLPLYDYELVDFAVTIPLSLRYQKRLYVSSLLEKLFADKLAAMAAVPIAPNKPLQEPHLTWRDRVLMLNRSPALSDWVLRRASASKQRENRMSVGTCSSQPTGPDPLDWWWYSHPHFRQKVVEILCDWDGMGGILNASGLCEALEKSQPRLFIQFGIPSLLTLRAFQEIVEDS